MKQRVETGGHDISDEAVARRFKRSVFNFLNVFTPLCDKALCYDNSEPEPALVFVDVGGARKILNKNRYQIIMESVDE